MRAVRRSGNERGKAHTLILTRSFGREGFMGVDIPQIQSISIASPGCALVHFPASTACWRLPKSTSGSHSLAHRGPMLQPHKTRLLPMLPTSFGRAWVGRTRSLSMLAALFCALLAQQAYAQTDAYADVSRLVRAGQFNEAMAKADQYLASKPRDPQMRFIKGVIQSESGKTSEAVATFTRLTEEFPELPEPYNNLAVLYAAQGQVDKARTVLEMAIRTHPSYATAHENLGDIYAKLASQAYSKALQLDTGNPAVSPKLSMIRSLAQDGKKDRQAPAEQVAQDKTATRPAGPTSAAAVPTPTPAAPTAPAAAPAQATAAPAAPAAKPAVTESASDAVKNDVKAAVQAWAKAWSAKDLNAYLGSYASGFAPPSGLSRREWEAERKARILPRSRISVGINNLNITLSNDGKRATAQFQQTYNSDNVNATSRKSLEMVKTGNRWQILRESTGS